MATGGAALDFWRRTIDANQGTFLHALDLIKNAGQEQIRPAKKPSTARRQLRNEQLLKIVKEYAADLRKIIEALRKKRLH